MENVDELVGKQIWLEYFDQNTKFEQAFKPQFCTVERQLTCGDWADDWYLVRLSHQLTYDAAEYDHLLIGSRLVGCRIGDEQPASVAIVLVPDTDLSTYTFKPDIALYVAWGMASRSSVDNQNMIRRP